MRHRVGEQSGPARPVPNPSRNWSSKVRLLQTTRTLHQDKEGWQRNFVPGSLFHEEARALGGKFGKSELLTVAVGGGPIPPAELVGLQSFSLQTG